jgi:hypothetical protein
MDLVGILWVTSRKCITVAGASRLKREALDSGRLTELLSTGGIYWVSAQWKTPNRAFLQGFSATHFPNFCLCRRAAVFTTILGCRSVHPEIPFPAVVLEREFGPR